MTSPKITAGLSVAFQTEVLDGGIVTSCKRSRNLVLDVGLDLFASYPFGQLFGNVVLGTGTRPTRRDSGHITASQAGSTVTASGAFFEAADVGRLLKFDSGDEVYITAFNSATEVIVADSVARAASEFTVWYVNATGHEAEHSRVSSYSAETGTFTNGVYTLTRTFTSAPFTDGAMIKEVGWSPTGSGTLFGRALVPAGGDFVGSGKQYRVTVSGSCRYGPAETMAQADVGSNGFSTGGAYAIEFVPVGGVTAATGFLIGLSASSAALVPMQAMANESLNDSLAYLAATRGAYVSGTCRAEYNVKFAASAAVLGNIRSINFIRDAGSAAYRFGRLLLNSNQAKDAMHTLSLTFGMSWGRTLVN